MEIQLLAFMFLTIAILNDAKVPSRYSFQGPGAQAVFNCVVEIGKDNEGDIGFRRGDARHYTLYTGILGNILSSLCEAATHQQKSTLFQTFFGSILTVFILFGQTKMDFLAQVPAFQYQYPVITDSVSLRKADLQREVERIDAKGVDPLHVEKTGEDPFPSLYDPTKQAQIDKFMVQQLDQTVNERDDRRNGLRLQIDARLIAAAARGKDLKSFIYC
ncbi:hypothetical protein Ahy_B04g073498 isoform A [Arachis hypogaea]|uniref:Uncharacterized protein n=1 Tax=Arachis hypogaea TaxID=3818 RepID=A0A444ZQJ5_ARAHY|nr:hypothetical protein Ahy_B04g073498 isoform A [Arachis hypogaea]